MYEMIKKMPYGKHKGENMDDIPPEYLLFLLDNKRCSGNVYAYIDKNKEGIICRYAKNIGLPVDVVKYLRTLKLNVNKILYDKAESLFKKYCKTNN